MHAVPIVQQFMNGYSLTKNEIPLPLQPVHIIKMLSSCSTLPLLALQIYITVYHQTAFEKYSVAFAPSPSHAQISDLI